MSIEKKIAEIFDIVPEQAKMVLNKLVIDDYANLISFSETGDKRKIKELLTPYISKYLRKEENIGDLTENVNSLLNQAIESMDDGFSNDYAGWAKKHTDSMDEVIKFQSALKIIEKIKRDLTILDTSIEGVLEKYENSLRQLGVSNVTVVDYIEKESPHLIEKSSLISEDKVNVKIAQDVKRLKKVNKYSLDRAIKDYAKESGIPERTIEFALEVAESVNRYLKETHRSELEEYHALLGGFSTPSTIESAMTTKELKENIIVKICEEK